ncbi:hypothetical protein C5167_021260 [Papaver somniferum]|uniref:F-box associated beta-propeller type 3 domain-containing protein n=1 Tax=Papaver somniferum TaxID=3469 RepID=A0A4Y7IVE7_PAPSO|nr:hypothetical protein C5167_021260 [Papaver somniferum]
MVIQNRYANVDVPANGVDRDTPRVQWTEDMEAEWQFHCGEQISLPRFRTHLPGDHIVSGYGYKSVTGDHIVSGFGYNSITDEYKVVRIHYDDYTLWKLDKPKGQVQVYTLGSGSRPDGGRSQIDIPSRGFLANGALRWLDEDWNIVKFDLEYEHFSLLPSAPSFRPEQPELYAAFEVLMQA